MGGLEIIYEILTEISVGHRTNLYTGIVILQILFKFIQLGGWNITGCQSHNLLYLQIGLRFGIHAVTQYGNPVLICQNRMYDNQLLFLRKDDGGYHNIKIMIFLVLTQWKVHDFSCLRHKRSHLITQHISCSDSVGTDDQDTQIALLCLIGRQKCTKMQCNVGYLCIGYQTAQLFFQIFTGFFCNFVKLLILRLDAVQHRISQLNTVSIAIQGCFQMRIDRIHQLLLLIKEYTGQAFKFMNKVLGNLVGFILLLHDIDRNRLQSRPQQMQSYINLLTIFQIRKIL